MADPPLSAVLTAIHATGDADVPKSLSGARSVFGGVPVAIAVAAAERKLWQSARVEHQLDPPTGSLPPLRVVHTSFLSPMLPGAVTTAATVLRRGRSAAVITAQALQQNKVVTAITATFGSAKPNPRRTYLPPAAQLPRWQDTPLFEATEHVSHLSDTTVGSDSSAWENLTPMQFMRTMELRYHQGAPADIAHPTPDSTPDRRFGAWMRWREDRADAPPRHEAPSAVAAALPSLSPLPGPHATARFIGLCDNTWPPPVMRVTGRGVMVASLAWSFEFFPPPPDAPAAAPEDRGWVYHKAVLQKAVDGYTNLATETFDARGHLRAAGRQTLAYWEPSPSAVAKL